MNTGFQVIGVKTPLILAGDDLPSIIVQAARESPAGGFTDGDVLVIAESPVATAEGRAVRLDRVVPSDRARELGARYGMDPRLAEVVLGESDAVMGGVAGFLLSLKQGTLLPNAGVDLSNTPPGTALPLPRDPDGSASRIRRAIGEKTGRKVAVIVADSRTHAMRLGCSSVAIGCAGIRAVIDERGRTDLYGHVLEVTQRAVADNIASAAVLVMGEADESVPCAIVRGLGLPMVDETGVPSIAADECLFMGVALHADPSVLRGKDKP
ncbi:MAG TPA: coenzyme F420-0:L-glutamate ligase [Methanomicrobiales archaeon]|jgi:coenzyme F420-0:L-glutamate ligase|nr:coenzyme F420-0:L-glutamate ligase [Methanomicrobiales archaeon]